MADVYNISVVRLTAEGSLAGQLVTNVTYWERAGDIILWDVGAMQGLAEAYAAWLEDSLALVQSAQMEWSRVIVTQMKEEGPLQYYHVPAAPIPGVLTDEALPNSIAACATISTGLGGRSYRGRIYVAGLTDVQVQGNLISDAARIAINNSVGDLVTAEAFTNYTLGVYSRYSNNAPRAAGVFTPATGVALRDNIVDTQRRRLPGRGR